MPTARYSFETGSATIIAGGSHFVDAWAGTTGYVSGTEVPGQNVIGSGNNIGFPGESGISFSPANFIADDIGVGGTLVSAAFKFTYNTTSTTASEVSVSGSMVDATPTVANTSGTHTIEFAESYPDFALDTFGDPFNTAFTPNAAFQIEFNFSPGNGEDSLIISDFWIEVTYSNGNLWWKGPENTLVFAPTSPGPGFTEVPTPDPQIDKILSPQGPIAGGVPFTIVGSGFGEDATVEIGGIPATSVVVHDQTMITGITDAFGGGIAGPVDIIFGAEDPTHTGQPGRANVSAEDVTVTNPDAEFDTLTDGYLYYLLLAVSWTPTPPTFVTPPTVYPPTTVPPGFTGPYVPVGPPDDEGWWLSIDESFSGAAVLVSESIPRDPRTWFQLGGFAEVAAATNWMGGFPGIVCVKDNRMIYASNNYSTGNDRPPIHAFDGLFDRELCTIPPTTTGTIPRGILTFLVGGGHVFVSTFDSGSSDTDFTGRVFELDPTTGVLSQIATPFANGELPYAMAWHMDRLWVGTHQQSSTQPGTIYYHRIGIDDAWTSDYVLSSSSLAGCTSLLSFNGALYAGGAAASGSRGKVIVRNPDTTWSTSDTGTGGTAAANNAYIAMLEFEGKLYASYYNPDTTPVSLIRQFDGSSWTTVFSGSSGSGTNKPYIIFFAEEDQIFALAGGLGVSPVLLQSTTGAFGLWNNRTAFLSQTTPTSTAVPGAAVLLR